MNALAPTSLYSTLAMPGLRTIEQIYQIGVPLDGKCYLDSYKRIARAAPEVCGRTLPEWSGRRRFCRIWGSLIRKDGRWNEFPKKYRGKGAAGALAMAGWGEVIRKPEIWTGALRPGAVMQGWRTRAIYRGVRDGRKPAYMQMGDGHSFVFVGYEKRGELITGLRVADSGFHRSGVIGRNAWLVLFGANIA